MNQRYSSQSVVSMLFAAVQRMVFMFGDVLGSIITEDRSRIPERLLVLSRRCFRPLDSSFLSKILW